MRYRPAERSGETGPLDLRPRHVLAEAPRHLLETLRGRVFPPDLDDYIAEKALLRHSRQLTVPQPGRRPPAPGPDHLHRRFPLACPLVDRRHRRQTARESSRYERARLASLSLQNAIRAARTAPGPVQDEAPAATTHADGHHHDQHDREVTERRGHQQAQQAAQMQQSATTRPQPEQSRGWHL